MPEGNPKPEPGEVDPAKLAQLLELELMQKRAAWQRSKSSMHQLRILSFFFLFLVIAGALVAFFFLFSPSRVSDLRSARDAAPTPSPSATAAP